MSIAIPLTASSVIQLSIISTSAEISKDKLLKSDLGIYAKDIVAISRLGIEKHQKEEQVEATRKIEEIPSEVIRISSTIGRANIIGNLTNNQATNLYHKIATLL
tara:strand:+ start:103 stop:414 length:312 start_codon:yes stop_codon:yes gene_type:complete